MLTTAGRRTATSPTPPSRLPLRPGPDNIQLDTWEWEGGHDGTRPQGTGTSPANASPTI